MDYRDNPLPLSPKCSRRRISADPDTRSQELNIQERTVKLHRTATTTKLKVRSVAELAILVSGGRSV